MAKFNWNKIKRVKQSDLFDLKEFTVNRNRYLSIKRQAKRNKRVKRINKAKSLGMPKYHPNDFLWS